VVLKSDENEAGISRVLTFGLHKTDRGAHAIQWDGKPRVGSHPSGRRDEFKLGCHETLGRSGVTNGFVLRFSGTGVSVLTPARSLADFIGICTKSTVAYTVKYRCPEYRVSSLPLLASCSSYAWNDI
jgi:hypothetical protein